ncbi:MAG: NUDIX hydrolase [Alphaproteobacteria bacterium]|nr:NUDIX hydrolase [Alphaproteobacteria bacterium]
MAPSHAVPRPAATVMLLRNGATGLEVFMVVRHDAIDFASGALVFPGGRVDPGDHEIAARPELCPAVAGLDATRLALRVAAIRETFEESGILLARPRGSEALLTAERLRDIAAAQRAPLCQQTVRFSDILLAEDLVLASDLLVPFAHWITPPNQAKRYDTHFFLAVAPRDQVGVHDGMESVDSLWISPTAAREGVRAGRYKMVFPTHMNLTKLGRSDSAQAAIATARLSRIVTVEPVPLRSESGRRQLRIPPEADYGGEIFTVTLPPAMPKPAAE